MEGEGRSECLASDSQKIAYKSCSLNYAKSTLGSDAVGISISAPLMSCIAVHEPCVYGQMYEVAVVVSNIVLCDAVREPAPTGLYRCRKLCAESYREMMWHSIRRRTWGHLHKISRRCGNLNRS